MRNDFRTKIFRESLGRVIPLHPRHRAGPPPSAVIKLLHGFKDQGGDVIAFADEVLKRRVAASIEDSTGKVYFSHLSMIQCACSRPVLFVSACSIVLLCVAAYAKVNFACHIL